MSPALSAFAPFVLIYFWPDPSVNQFDWVWKDVQKAAIGVGVFLVFLSLPIMTLWAFYFTKAPIWQRDEARSTVIRLQQSENDEVTHLKSQVTALARPSFQAAQTKHYSNLDTVLKELVPFTTNDDMGNAFAFVSGKFDRLPLSNGYFLLSDRSVHLHITDHPRGRDLLEHLEGESLVTSLQDWKDALLGEIVRYEALYSAIRGRIPHGFQRVDHPTDGLPPFVTTSYLSLMFESMVYRDRDLTPREIERPGIRVYARGHEIGGTSTDDEYAQIVTSLTEVTKDSNIITIRKQCEAAKTQTGVATAMINDALDRLRLRGQIPRGNGCADCPKP